MEDERITDYFIFSTCWMRGEMGLDPGQSSIISVIGDSMEPPLQEGDILLVDHRQNQVTDDGIYILRIDDRLMSKRLQRLIDGAIIIMSDNPVYKEQTINKDATGEIAVIGRAVWVGRKI